MKYSSYNRILHVKINMFSYIYDILLHQLHGTLQDLIKLLTK